MIIRYFPQIMILGKKILHKKARQPLYPKSDIQRFLVPDDKVDWAVDWPEYDPVDYTSSSVLAMPSWADTEIRLAAFAYAL